MDSIDITEVARRTGLTPRALRFYEARGLVSPMRSAAGRRHYGTGELARLHAVVALKRAGFSLAEIARLLAGRQANLGRLVAARIAALDSQAATLADTRALLVTVQSRLDRREPIDVATLCSLIEKGAEMNDQHQWKAVAERYLAPKGVADFAAAEAAMPPAFDGAGYAARWADLAARIEAALPLDPGSAEAGALFDQWQALLAPFAAVATPAMMEGVGRMYDDMGEWQDRQPPPFAPAVWAFVKEVGARRGGA